MACALDNLPRIERDVFIADAAMPPIISPIAVCSKIALSELLKAFKKVSERASLYSAHAIAREPLSVQKRMSCVLSIYQKRKFYIVY
ncbi:hypothetical protein [Coxiella endosymbiont of Amblyomma nuttalli]|uniref:hypothetical protein n=1 Tax=Coxiella endosymbiont of Amblyomma nuttalli TaxID=2749996 RepID=UPI001FCFE4B8|nr:hypothetical protein [Coxiella endosymbiont of Amblyomma nuttalli]